MASNSSNSTYVPTTLGKNAFRLKHKGDSIFLKEFDASSDEVVDAGNDIITIENHFFRTGEKLKYNVPDKGLAISISPSSPGNLLSTSFLPSEVYPIVIDSNKIKLALSRSLSLSNQSVDITGTGVGQIHSLECEKQNSKCLITIDNIIQSPVSIASTVDILNIQNARTLELKNLTGIQPGTILKIGSEYAKVISITNSSTNPGSGTVTLLRGKTVLGTDSVDFTSDTTYVSIVSGQYNIVQDKIYFVDSPYEGKKFNYEVKVSELNTSDSSFNLFNTTIKTGSLLVISSQNPPKGIEGNVLYYAIKNYENNFSFASSYKNAINNQKVQFDPKVGAYDELQPVTDLKISFIDLGFGSKFSGRAFLRSDYSGNAVFDDFSSSFNGITSSFELKNSGISTSGISSDNGVVLINNIFQYPEFGESFVFEEVNNKTNLTFIGIGTTGYGPKDYDVNVKGYPRGGIIVGYGLSSGSNYQPLNSAVLYETDKVVDSGNNIINNTNIGIAYSGSGYRYSPGYALSVTFEQDGKRISGYGTATIEFGHITAVDIIEPCSYPIGIQTPSIKISAPLEYENMELSGSLNGIGARVNLTISDSGEIEKFKFTNPGYGYTVGDVLSIPNLVGKEEQIPSEQLKVVILNVQKDTFSAWNIGKLRKLDDLTPFTNGTRRVFNIKENSQLLSLETLPGSEVEISQNVLVFLNDVLQIPNESYIFEGGTQLIMSEAPPANSTLRVYFYMGSDGDAFIKDIDPIIEVGDKLLVKKGVDEDPTTQFSRTVKKILSSDTLKTEIYDKKGLSPNSFTYRPLDFTPQSYDLIINGEYISKARESLNSKCVGFTSIATRTGSFNEANTFRVGIDTTNLEVGDYVESIYTDGYKIVYIENNIIGLSSSSTNTSIDSTEVKIWRKN